MLPFAEGALLNHNPVTKDDVTRNPKVIITYLLASVRAYILDQTRFRESGRRPGWVWITVSPHRQEYEAERQNEDEIISFQLYSVVTPGFPFSIRTFEPLKLLTHQPKLTPTNCQTRFQSWERKVLTSWVSPEKNDAVNVSVNKLLHDLMWNGTAPAVSQVLQIRMEYLHYKMFSNHSSAQGQQHDEYEPR